MRKRRLQRLIATLLMITLVFGNSSLTALAGSGADADTRGDAIKSGTGGSGGSRTNTTVLHRYGGGFKISILALELDTYAPKDIDKKRQKNKTPTWSVNTISITTC